MAEQTRLDETCGSARPYAIDLPSPATPAQVITGLPAGERPSVLWGRWFGGGVAIFIRPLRVAEPADARDVFDLLEEQPLGAEGFNGLGGGWVTALGYERGHTTAAFYDAVLRWSDAFGWRFECLGLAGAAERDHALLAHWRLVLAAATAAERSTARVTTFRTARPATETRDRYLAAVEAVIGRIHRGEFYQLNLCTRLHAELDGAPAALFAQLVGDLQPDYAALISGPDRAVLSASPELFVSVRGRQVHTSPIKGTAPRRGDEADSAALRASAKDAAENIMIVDLMRNDLSRVCVPGTVRVTELLGLQPHPGVWHLVSTVEGRLAAGVGTADLLRATFPPGSVTGAPKLAARRGIADLEPEPRGAYTGAIGLVSPCAGVELNVAIRTLEIAGGTVELGVGGGITVDSVPAREWAECLDKAAPVVAAAGGTLDPGLRSPPRPVPGELVDRGVFESMLAIGPTVLRLAAHLDRLDRSCRELYTAGVPTDLATRIRAVVGDHRPPRRTVVRVHAAPGSGQLAFCVTTDPAPVQARRTALRRATRPDLSWRHKWTDRRALQAAELDTARQAPGALPYFVGADGAGVSETSRGNLFCLRADGVWRTPPADDQLLPGVTRQEVRDLLADFGVPLLIERVSVPELQRAAGAFWTSSLSGAVEITTVDGRPLPAVPDLLDRVNHALGHH